MESPIDFSPALTFDPPNCKATPHTLFAIPMGNRTTGARKHGYRRHISLSNSAQILIYTDGYCLENGTDSPVAGCAYVFNFHFQGIVYFRLENRGPTGILYTHTANRAELRAVIAAVQFFVKSDEPYKELVIATNSEYVVRGATKDVAGWERTGWTTEDGVDVENKDLWDLLFREIQEMKECKRRIRHVRFWLIDQELNKEANAAAKSAATTGEPVECFKEGRTVAVPDIV